MLAMSKDVIGGHSYEPYLYGSEATLVNPRSRAGLVSPKSVNYGGLVRKAQNLGLDKLSGGIIASKTSWEGYLGSVEVPTFQGEPGQFTVGLALRRVGLKERGGWDKDYRASALLVIKKEDAQQFGVREFRNDVVSIADAWAGNGTQDRNARLLMMAAGGIGAAAARIASKGKANSGVLETGLAAVAGAAVGWAGANVLEALSEERKIKQISRLGGYVSDMVALVQLNGIKNHTENVREDEAMYKDLKDAGVGGESLNPGNYLFWKDILWSFNLGKANMRSGGKIKIYAAIADHLKSGGLAGDESLREKVHGVFLEESFGF